MGQTSRREASGSELGGRRSRPRFGRCSCCWTGFPGTRAQVRNGAWVKPRRSLPSGEVRALVPTCRPRVAPGGGRLSVPCRPRPLSLRAALNLCGGRHGAPPEPPAAECAPPAAGSPSAFGSPSRFSLFRKNRTGFPGTRAQVPPPSRVSKMRLAARACGALRLRVCRWECDPNGLAWFSWVAPSAPGPRRPTIGCWASLSGCGLASVHARLHVRPGCGGVLHS